MCNFNIIQLYFQPSVMCHFRKVLKQIAVTELQPDETVDAVREARLLAKVGVALLPPVRLVCTVQPSSLGVVVIGQLNWFRCLQLDHPYIVKFHDSFTDGEMFCIITEFCEVKEKDFFVQIPCLNFVFLVSCNHSTISASLTDFCVSKKSLPFSPND